MNENNQPRIEKKQFQLVGVNRFVRWDEDFGEVIQDSKEKLRSKVDSVRHKANTSESIKYFYSETGMQEGCNYLECVEVTDICDIPEGFTSRSLVLSDYAVFVADEGKGGEYARNTWLPQSGYTENFDVFGDLEIMDSDNGTCEFWLPVRRTDQ